MQEVAHIMGTANHLVAAACRAGASEAEVYMRYGPSTHIIWQHHCISQSSGWESNLALRIWHEGNSLVLTTNDFAPERLTALAEHACKQLKEHHGVPDRPLLVKGSSPLVFAAAAEEGLMVEEKIEAIETLLATVRSSWPLATTILNASYTEAFPWVGLANSHGFAAVYPTKSCSFWTWLEGDSGHLLAATSSKQFSDLNLQAMGRYLHERATYPQQPLMPVPNGRFPVLLSPIAAADLARVLGTLLTGENVLHALRPLRKRLNRAIATTAVTLIDDSTLPNGVKSRPIDDEGTPTEATTLIEKGVLKNFLHTRQTADQFGVPANGKATRANLWAPPHSTPSNIYLQAGDTAPEALRQEIENGLLVTGILEPGVIQGVAGNFVMLVQGSWVKNGQIVGQVHQVRLSLNIFELLRNIRACGNDLEFSPLRPNAGAPSLLIESMQVGNG